MLDPEPPAPSPGATARATWRRLRAARERRDPLGLPTRFERGFDKGADGERRLGERLTLEAARDGRATVLHDLTVGRGPGNIDHVVVGPSGVTIIDCKAWSGRVTISKGTLWQGRGPRTDVVDGVEGQVRRVYAVLVAAGRDDVPVRGVLCFVDENRGIAGKGMRHLGDVGIASVAPTLEFAFAGGPLTHSDVCDVRLLLEAAFVINGGVTDPGAPSAPLTVADILAAAPPRRPAAVRWRRSLSLVLVMAAVLSLIATGVVLIGTGIHSVEAQTRWMTRADLRAQEPEFRVRARRAAHGRVRGPAVRQSGSSYVLRYRHGRRCRVWLTVSRLPKVTIRLPPTVRTSGCS